MAGLLAAHAIARRFDRVTILERFCHSDESSSFGSAGRRGVPQSRCIHLLMAAGAAAFDELVPGWMEELLAHGAGPFDACADAVIQLPAGRLPRTRSGITAYSCSRALFEQALRRRLPASVNLLEEQKVTGLVINAQGEGVVGVHIADRRTADQTTLLADLIVDASGEGSVVCGWLAFLANQQRFDIETSLVKSGRHYVSRWFEMDPAHAPDWRCFSIAPSVDTAHRSAMILQAEENRWGVVLLAPVGDPLPDDDASFTNFLAHLGGRELQQAFGRAKPVSPIFSYGSTSNRMAHFELAAGWPQGLVVIGDAACTLDPNFGLGMTLAARGALQLRRSLDLESGASLSAIRFQKQLAKLNAEPWRLATGRELDGRPVAGEAHLRQLYDAAPSSPEIAHSLLAIQHLVRPIEARQEAV